MPVRRVEFLQEAERPGSVLCEAARPELAAADLERYSTTAFGPSRETALRLAGAASVISQRGSWADAGTQQAFDSAEQSLERLLQNSGGDLDRILEQALRFGSLEPQEARDVVIRLLGERVRDLRKDVYEELVR